MTVLGIGLDLVDLDQFRLLYGEEDEELLARCFTDGELKDAGDGVDRLARLAARFAAKEAVFKALGGAEGIAHTDIEVVRRASGAPQILLHGPAAELAAQGGVAQVQVTLTHSPAAAAAVALAMAGGPR
jgi:holo-[acyl-carrier protein] synthase